MGSVIRLKRKRKRCLGEVRVLRREEYGELELEAKVELIRSLIPLGLMHVQQLLDEEVEALAGARYERNDGAAGMRYGSNPGTVRVAGQRVAIRVPRVRGKRRGCARRYAKCFRSALRCSAVCGTSART